MESDHWYDRGNYQLIDPPPPLPGAALFLRPAVALMAGQGPGQIPEPRAADVLIRRPGHDVLVAEQPPEELQFRVAVLL